MSADGVAGRLRSDHASQHLGIGLVLGRVGGIIPRRRLASAERRQGDNVCADTVEFPDVVAERLV
jgi:hypothetical protein